VRSHSIEGPTGVQWGLLDVGSPREAQVAGTVFVWLLLRVRERERGGGVRRRVKVKVGSVGPQNCGIGSLSLKRFRLFGLTPRGPRSRQVSEREALGENAEKCEYASQRPYYSVLPLESSKTNE